MLTYARLRSSPSTHKALTGLEIGQFAALLVKWQRLFPEMRRRDARSKGIRGVGAGRKGTIRTDAQRLLLVLVYFRQYPTQEFMGILFSISQERVCELIRDLQPILEAVLGSACSLPQRPALTNNQMLASIPGLVYLIDGAERPIHRPKDPVRQKECYSGRKKRHCVKNNVIVDHRTRRIVGLGTTYNGAKHDKSMADEDRFTVSPQALVLGDTGFQGYEMGAVPMIRPKKKPRRKELSDSEKQDNRMISRERVRVEHAIRGMKIWRIAKDIFRNRRQHFDDSAAYLAAGLWNFRLVA